MVLRELTHTNNKIQAQTVILLLLVTRFSLMYSFFSGGDGRRGGGGIIFVEGKGGSSDGGGGGASGGGGFGAGFWVSGGGGAAGLSGSNVGIAIAVTAMAGIAVAATLVYSRREHVWVKEGGVSFLKGVKVEGWAGTPKWSRRIHGCRCCRIFD